MFEVQKVIFDYCWIVNEWYFDWVCNLIEDVCVKGVSIFQGGQVDVSQKFVVLILILEVFDDMEIM